MQQSLHFRRLKSHLEDPKYEDIRKAISEIEAGEPAHNKEVADIMNNIGPNIRNAIYSQVDSKLAPPGIEKLKEINESQSQALPHFILERIVEYFVEKASGKNATLKVRQTNADIYQLIKEADYMVAVGMGDEPTMNWLLDRIESMLLPKQLDELQKRGKRINDLFTNGLKKRAKDLILDIEDECFAGKCDFKYCRLFPSLQFWQLKHALSKK